MINIFVSHNAFSNIVLYVCLPSKKISDFCVTWGTTNYSSGYVSASVTLIGGGEIGWVMVSAPPISVVCPTLGGRIACISFPVEGERHSKNWTRRTKEFVERILYPASAPEQRTEWVNAVFDLWIPHPVPPITFAGDTNYAMLYEFYFYNHFVISIFFSFKQSQSPLTFGSCRVSPKDWLPQMGRWPRITFLGPKHVSLLPAYFQVTMLFLFWCFSVFDIKTSIKDLDTGSSFKILNPIFDHCTKLESRIKGFRSFFCHEFKIGIKCVSNLLGTFEKTTYSRDDAFAL